MNRDELLELCFSKPVGDLPVPSKWFTVTEPDEEDPQIIHTRALVGLGYKRVLVRLSQPPGGGISESATTLTIAAIMNVCVDPDHGGQDHVTGLLAAAHAEAASHPVIQFAGLFASDELRLFYEQAGYTHPVLSPDRFLVCPLGDDEWPSGRVDPRSVW